MPQARPIATLEYHDYLAAICFLEESQTVRVSSHRTIPRSNTIRFADYIHDQVSRDFTTACCGYFDRVEANRASFVAANRSVGYSKGTRDTNFAEYLYNPATWISFGRADASAITLVDDFYPLIEITADIRSPIDQATLAFCPKLSSIGISGLPFIEPHELFDAPRPNPDKKKTRKPATHTFQKQSPLITIARCKLGGLVLLGHGLLMLQTVMKSMQRKINEVLTALKEAIERRDSDVEKLGICQADIDATRIVLLDGQGAEDLVILIAGTNYSISIAIVTALRCLTFSDVLKCQPGLQVLFDQDSTPIHRAMAQIGKVVQGRANEKATFDDIRDNHIFSLTYSTLGITAEAFRHPDKSQLHGCAEIYVQIDVNPGHMPAVETKLFEAHNKALTILKRNSIGTSIGQLGNYYRFLIGRHDYTTTLAVNPREHDLVAVQVCDFFTYLRVVFSELSESVEHGVPVETGLQDLSSSLVIPFPRLENGTNEGSKLWPKKIGQNHIPLMHILRQIRMRLCNDPPIKTSAHSIENRLSHVKMGKLDSDEREKRMRFLRIPITLRRTISYLYQDFAGYIGDPFLFDSVLDLYDIFLGLQYWITKVLPKEQIHKTSKGSYFGEQSVDELDELLTAIQNAIMHRVYMALPNSELRDEAVDFRGGLNKLVAAADVPLKCGLFLLESSIAAMDDGHKRRGRSSVIDHVQFGRVSAVTRMTFHPRTLCHPIVGKADLCLAHVDMNVAHIFRPAEFVNYFHEVAHLIEAVRPIEFKPEIPNSIREVRWCEQEDFQREIYANLMTHLLVFGTDSDLYIRHHIASFSVHPISTGTGNGMRLPTQEVSIRFMEVLIRTFFVSNSIQEALNTNQDISPAKWSLDHPWNVTRQELSNERVANMEKQFRKMVEDYGLFFWGFNASPNDSVDRLNHDECARRFRIALRRSYYLVAQIWRSVLNVYQEWFNSAKTIDDSLFKNLVNESLDTARPLSRSSLVTTNRRKVEPMDTIAYTCHLIRSYITRCYGSLSPKRGIHLFRDHDTGEVCFSRKVKGVIESTEPNGWNDFQLDNCHGQLFCVSPETRRKRLQSEIVILKSLWDTSTHFRAERLLRIIMDNWPELESHFAETT